MSWRGPTVASSQLCLPFEETVGRLDQQVTAGRKADTKFIEEKKKKRKRKGRRKDCQSLRVSPIHLFGPTLHLLAQVWEYSLFVASVCSIKYTHSLSWSRHKEQRARENKCSLSTNPITRCNKGTAVIIAISQVREERASFYCGTRLKHLPPHPVVESTNDRG